MKAQEIQMPRARSSTDLAAKIAQAARARQEKFEADRRKMPKGECWVMGCNTNPRHIGIIFAEDVDPNVAQKIHGGMWFSTTHDIEDVFHGTRDDIVCSECLVTGGARMPLRVEQVETEREWGYCFRVPSAWAQRFLHKANMAELAEFFPQEPEPEPVKVPPELKAAFDSDFTPIVSAPKLEIPKGDEYEPLTAEEFKKVAGSAKGGAA